jgi:antirestriction protein ArdC
MKANEVLDRIIRQIEAGVAPWRIPWSCSGVGGLPTNAATNQSYSGINILSLWADQAIYGYSSGLWIGYEQAIKKGGHVRRGETSHKIVKVNVINKKDESGERTGDTFKLPMTVSVFNIDQCEGLDHLKPAIESHDWNPIERGESLMTSSGATIEYGGDRAFYVPSADKIRLPERERFANPEDFYATAVHELGHWTGHESRLDRKYGKKFGDNAYAMEELVAEISCAITLSRINLLGDVQNHASYLDHWVKTLKQSPQFLLTAASAASKASDYLIAKLENTNE